MKDTVPGHPTFIVTKSYVKRDRRGQKYHQSYFCHLHASYFHEKLTRTNLYPVQRPSVTVDKCCNENVRNRYDLVLNNTQLCICNIGI